MQRLNNKIVIVTGGAKGIGKATIKRFLEEGAKVVCWDIDTAAGTQLLNEHEGMPLEFQQVNTVDREAVDKAVQEVIKKHSQIDVLINNAGITRDATLKKMTPEQWKTVLDVNLTGVFNCTQAISEHMVQQGTGKNCKCGIHCWTIWEFWTDQLCGH